MGLNYKMEMKYWLTLIDPATEWWYNGILVW